MNEELLKKLSAVTKEEREILSGRRQIDRTLYMDASRDVITGDKLLSRGKNITIRPGLYVQGADTALHQRRRDRP